MRINNLILSLLALTLSSNLYSIPNCTLIDAWLKSRESYVLGPVEGLYESMALPLKTDSIDGFSVVEQVNTSKNGGKVTTTLSMTFKDGAEAKGHFDNGVSVFRENKILYINDMFLYPATKNNEQILNKPIRRIPGWVTPFEKGMELVKGKGNPTFAVFAWRAFQKLGVKYKDPVVNSAVVSKMRHFESVLQMGYFLMKNHNTTKAKNLPPRAIENAFALTSAYASYETIFAQMGFRIVRISRIKHNHPLIGFLTLGALSKLTTKAAEWKSADRLIKDYKLKRDQTVPFDFDIEFQISPIE